MPGEHLALATIGLAAVGLLIAQMRGVGDLRERVARLEARLDNHREGTDHDDR